MPSAAPTPTIAPVIVWVVLTGIRELHRDETGECPTGLGAETADGAQLRDPVRHRVHDGANHPGSVPRAMQV
jgi:hypothetical protein